MRDLRKHFPENELAEAVEKNPRAIEQVEDRSDAFGVEVRLSQPFLTRNAEAPMGCATVSSSAS